MCSGDVVLHGTCDMSTWGINVFEYVTGLNMW